MKKRHLKKSVRIAYEKIRNTLLIITGLYFWALSILFVIGYRL